MCICVYISVFGRFPSVRFPFKKILTGFHVYSESIVYMNNTQSSFQLLPVSFCSECVSSHVVSQGNQHRSMLLSKENSLPNFQLQEKNTLTALCKQPPVLLTVLLTACIKRVKPCAKRLTFGLSVVVFVPMMRQKLLPRAEGVNILVVFWGLLAFNPVLLSKFVRLKKILLESVVQQCWIYVF